MIYRFATVDDVDAIVDLVNNHGGYEELTAQIVSTGGDWFLAIDDENANMLVGCVWGIRDRQHASIDYLAVHTDYQDGLNWRALLDRLFNYMHNNLGINFFHGLVWRPNGEWAKITGDAFTPLEDGAIAFYQENTWDEP